MTRTTLTPTDTRPGRHLPAPAGREVPDLDRLATDLATHGLRPVAGDVDRVVAHARTVGVHAPSVDVLADVTAPDVVRARAFGQVARALASASVEPRQVVTAA